MLLGGRFKLMFSSAQNGKKSENCVSDAIMPSNGSLNDICFEIPNISLADPRGAPGTRAPSWGSKFFHFHAVFGKNVKNNSNFGSWRPPLGKILDPPLYMIVIILIFTVRTAFSTTSSVADLHIKILDASPLVQILSISWRFWGNLAKSYVSVPPENWCPHLGEILDPSLVIKVYTIFYYTISFLKKCERV